MSENSKNLKFSLIIGSLILLILGTFVLNLSVGNADLSLSDLYTDSTVNNIVFHYRLPKAIAALLSGIALSVSGLLLQELFRNPLADPSVLGLTSASGLGVAVVIFLSSIIGVQGLIQSSWLIVRASFLGALLAMLLLLYFSSKLNSTTALIIIGMMIAGFASALVGLMQFFAPSEKIKSFLLWTFGAVSGLSWQQITVFTLSITLGILLSIITLKGLSGLRLGEHYATTMGINVKKIRWLILISSSVLTAATTAFVGPIAFIGLAVPHICRMFFKETNIYRLYIFVVLVGSLIMLTFSWVAQMFPTGTLPINILTSLVGTPIVISIIWSRNKHQWNA